MLVNVSTFFFACSSVINNHKSYLNMADHWGEIPKSDRKEIIPDIMPDIERSMNNFCLTDYPDDDFMERLEKIVLPPMDPLVLYAISLHKYTNDMIEMIRVAELATEVNLIPPEDAAPPMPEMPEIYVRHTRNQLNFIPKEFTSFSQGEDVEVPELSESVVKQILTKSVVTMFAHIGYESTHKSVLDVMTDVLETFFKKICEKFIIALKDEENYGSGFPHTIERVLIETGFGGVKGLHDYYQSRVVKYIQVLQKRCKELNDYYATLLLRNNPSPIDKINKIIRVKVEEDDDLMDQDNPEIHFTAMDEVCSSLEPGYQLLNSLKEDTNLQGLPDTEEDVGSSSPNVVSMSNDDISQLSFTKKKRFKQM